MIANIDINLTENMILLLYKNQGQKIQYKSSTRFIYLTCKVSTCLTSSLTQSELKEQITNRIAEYDANLVLVNINQNGTCQL